MFRVLQVAAVDRGGSDVAVGLRVIGTELDGPAPGGLGLRPVPKPAQGIPEVNPDAGTVRTEGQRRTVEAGRIRPSGGLFREVISKFGVGPEIIGMTLLGLPQDIQSGGASFGLD